MSRIVWGEPGNRLYETGIDRGVFYPQGGSGVPWNGLIAVSEAPSGADILEHHYNGDKFLQQRMSESFAATISAYSYPREFERFDGTAPEYGITQQRRKPFNLSYRTKVVNDLGDESYLIHLVYNAVVSPTPRNLVSINGSVTATEFEWQLNTIPEILPSGEASAHLVINSKIAYPWAIEALENAIYGSSDSDSRFPGMLEVLDLFENASILQVTDNGDGTFTVDGPDEAFEIITTPWIEKRRNLFADPLAKTTATGVWGSTAGLPTTFTDPDGTTWARFTRAAAGNVRLADMKVGTSLLASRFTRFIFEARSSTTRTVNMAVRPDVGVSTTTVSAGPLSLEAGVSKRVEFGISTHANAPTAGAGLTITHDSTNVGETLDIRMVDIEYFWDHPGSGAPVLFGQTPTEDWRQVRWLGAANASASVLEEREVSFEITWPSVVYIDSTKYKISSL